MQTIDRTQVTITEEILQLGSTSGVGWNRQQLRALGVAWPLRAGWKRDLVGKVVDAQQVDDFLNLAGAAGKVPTQETLVQCKRCGEADVSKSWLSSQGKRRVPRCKHCHGKVEILEVYE